MTRMKPSVLRFIRGTVAQLFLRHDDQSAASQPERLTRHRTQEFDNCEAARGEEPFELRDRVQLISRRALLRVASANKRVVPAVSRSPG